MMKKIFSKRSGFTLVEIVVAFAVFAIMAAMILQVLNLVMLEKQNNADFAEKLRTQEEMIVKNGRYGDYNEANKTDTLNFTFGEDESYNIDYEMLFPEKEDKSARYEDGLAYFIGPGASSSADDDPNAGIDATAGAGAQMDRLDTRITGTGGFNSINVYRVVKDDTYSGPGARYFIEVSADGKDMANEMVPYAQYKLYFYMKDQYDDVKSNVTYTDADGSTYKRKVPKKANIIDAGYVNSSKLEWNDSTCRNFTDYFNSGSAENKYNVRIMNDNCIRVGSPYVTNDPDGAEVKESSGKRGIRFRQSEYSRFYVVFEEDPQLTVNSFGEEFAGQGNVVDGGYKISYSPVPILNDDGTPTDKNYVNIYGAFEFEKKTN